MQRPAETRDIFDYDLTRDLHTWRRRGEKSISGGISGEHGHPLEASHFRHGDAAIIASASAKASRVVGPQRPLLRCILCSGSHSADTIPPADLDQLAEEISSAPPNQRALGSPARISRRHRERCSLRARPAKPDRFSSAGSPRQLLARSGRRSRCRRGRIAGWGCPAINNLLRSATARADDLAV
jgi:hypothetical protein